MYILKNPFCLKDPFCLKLEILGLKSLKLKGFREKGEIHII